MKKLKEKIYSTLSTDIALAASTQAIRPIKLEKKDNLPAITYQVQVDPDHTFDGESGFAQALAEINIYAKKQSQTESIFQELKAAIVKLPGSYAGIRIHNLFTRRVVEDFESTEDEFRINVQFTINFTEG